MDNNAKYQLQKQSAMYIADLFKNHQVACRIEENKLLFSKEQISIEIYCFDRNSNPELNILQLDVYIHYGSNTILESFAGTGKDFVSANINAFENFQNNSFHIILSAFFTSKYDKEVQKYSWNINGKKFEIFSSNIGIRGTISTNFTTEWLNQFEIEIQKLQLKESLYWIRLFYSQAQNQTTFCEILLNNEYCISIQEKSKKFDWHKQEEFYSLRVFMILKNRID